MVKNRRDLELRKKLTQVREDQSDIESDASDAELYEIENQANRIEFSSSKDEDLHHTAPRKRRACFLSESESGGSDRYITPGKKRVRYIPDFETESELDTADRSDNEEISTQKAADGTLWETMKDGRNTGRFPGHTKFKDVSGPTSYAKRNIILGTVKSAFNLIIDEGIMKYIKSCTELEARKVLKKDWTVTKSQLWAFVAILYARGAYEGRNLKSSYLWCKKWGPPFFSQTMCRDKFREILRFIRFDKKNERSERLKTDKFALISKVWDKFIENSQACYKPGPNITVDEQLFSTKARCPFTQYMPNKPDKFGIKFWLAADVRSKYLLNGFPYLGKNEASGSNIPLSEFVVYKITEPFLGCGRNITTDNFFTSLSLAKRLVVKKTSLVGTIRGNRKELPKIAKAKKDNMTRFSTQLYKTKDCTLTIYKSKPNKKVLVLSSKHRSVEIEKNKKCVPETIKFYNNTKYGVDVLDQMARKYSTKAGSRRWPLQVFYNILDLAAINAWVLYKEVTQEKMSRKAFILQLAEELSGNYNHEAENTFTPPPNIQNIEKRLNCQIHISCKRNRSKGVCAKCNKKICGKCILKTEYICKNCFE